MRCNNCGKTIPEVSTVCNYCNLPVDSSKSVVNFGEINDYNYDSNKFDIKVYIKEPKNRKIVFMGITVIAIVILLFIFMVMSMFSRNNKVSGYDIFHRTINSVGDYLDDNFLMSKTLASGSYNLILKINKDNYQFDGLYGYDIKNKILKLDGKMLNALSSDDVVVDFETFSFDTYLKENNLFFSSDEIFNDPILFEIDDQTGLLKTKNYDLYSLVHGVLDSVDYTLKDMTYEYGSDTINYRGTNVNAKKVSLKLDNKGKLKFLTSFYTNLIDDANFVNEYARINDKKSSDVIKILENYRTTAEYKYSAETDDYVEVNAYYSSKKLYRIEYIDKTDNDINKVQLDIGETKYYLDYFKNNDNQFSFTIALTVKEIEDYLLKDYEITYDTDKYVTNIILSLKEDKQSVVKKREIEEYKNIKDLTDIEINDIKLNTKAYLNDTDFIDRLRKYFEEKCNINLNCVCTDNSDECDCTYEDRVITCPRDLVEIKEVQE